MKNKSVIHNDLQRDLLLFPFDEIYVSLSLSCLSLTNMMRNIRAEANRGSVLEMFQLASLVFMFVSG